MNGLNSAFFSVVFAFLLIRLTSAVVPFFSFFIDLLFLMVVVLFSSKIGTLGLLFFMSVEFVYMIFSEGIGLYFVLLSVYGSMFLDFGLTITHVNILVAVASTFCILLSFSAKFGIMFVLIKKFRLNKILGLIKE